MTDQEMELLLLEWMQAHGGVVSDEDLGAIAAILGEHFLSPQATLLDDARKVLGLK